MNEPVANPYRIRSVLFIPSINRRFFEKILTLNGIDKPDALVFDLEDSIDSSHKDAARENLNEFFSKKDRGLKIRKDYFVGIRPNSIGTPWFEKDIQSIRKINPHFVLIPKIESASDVLLVRKKTNVKQILAVIETTRGLLKKEEILQALKPNDIFALGYEDLSADLMIERPPLDTLNPISFILLDCLIAARRNNISMIDSVSRHFHEKDLEKLRKECLHTVSWGLTGKKCIHPNQVAIINRIYGDAMRKKMNYGNEIIGNFDRLANGSFVIVNKKNEMMDKPSHRMYNRLKELSKKNVNRIKRLY